MADGAQSKVQAAKVRAQRKDASLMVAVKGGYSSCALVDMPFRTAQAPVPAAPVEAEAPPKGESPPGVLIPEVKPGEDVFGYIERTEGEFSMTRYRQILGAANEFKEGDQMVGVAAADEGSRANARVLLGNTSIGQLCDRPPYEDALYTLALSRVDATAMARVRGWSLRRLRGFLLDSAGGQIMTVAPGLASDVIACVVKLMSNEELVELGAKIFNPLPGSQIGAQGYLGARLQPNSPTDHVDDIRWQVFSGWSFAVGDVVLGTNPVSSEVESVAGIERALQDIIDTFGLRGIIPHCVLAHIDVLDETEREHPGLTELWFQSLAGTVDANETFDVTVEEMQAHASGRTGPYGLYFETGQGADATNGHAAGFDMVLHESRKYGFSRALEQDVAAAREKAGHEAQAWVHVNDVAGFIGPEVFRTREQLVRCCLEDIAMGKLHGLTIGLDVCSTLHMSVTLDDLDWCLDQIMPANPAYLMALPTKNDPMLSYLTTSFQDHVRLRDRFGYRVSDAMWGFFQRLGVIDALGRPTEHFGEPSWVYLQYCRAKGDNRPKAEILAEAKAQIEQVKARGVFVAQGYGGYPWQLEPGLDAEVRRLYEDAKLSLMSEWSDEFVGRIPDALPLRTRASDRDDYILRPPHGEQLDEPAVAAIEALRGEYGGAHQVQIVISDGLNAFALMDEGHLLPFLAALREQLTAAGYQVAPRHVVLTAGRVRAGYQVGELLFGVGEGDDGAQERRGIIHIIGERPGTGHHNFSAYLTAPTARAWGTEGVVDHDDSKVVCGISDTALSPAEAVEDVVRIFGELMSGEG